MQPVGRMRDSDGTPVLAAPGRCRFARVGPGSAPCPCTNWAPPSEPGCPDLASTTSATWY